MVSVISISSPADERHNVGVHRAEQSGTRFAVLMVCTGNICRSPVAERLLTAAVGATGPLVASAGTRAVVGHPVSAPMVPLLAAAGADPAEFAARRLTAGAVRRADLVLGMTREHRGAVVSLEPAALRRTLTLRELARLAAEVDPAQLPAAGPADRLAALVPLAMARRGRVVVRPADDDIEDPIGRSNAVYARVFAEIQTAVDTLARLLVV